jgi:hypothetical protein
MRGLDAGLNEFNDIVKSSPPSANFEEFIRIMFGLNMLPS